MESKKRYTITSALPYTNGRLHIGHLAGAYIPADIYARFKRITDNDVAYICGSDEHGVAISIRAKKENKTPKEIIDKYHALIKKALMILVFRSIIIQEHPRKSTMKQHLNFLSFSIKKLF